MKGEVYISLAQARRFLKSNIPELIEIAHMAYDQKYLDGDYEITNPIYKACDNLGCLYEHILSQYYKIRREKSYKEASDYMYEFFQKNSRIFPKDDFEANIRWAVSVGHIERNRLFEFKSINK